MKLKFKLKKNIIVLEKKKKMVESKKSFISFDYEVFGKVQGR